MKRVAASAWMALVLLVGAPHAPASARPFTVDDLLAQESFGDAAIDPSGRWLVFEQRDRYDRLPRYDVGYSPSEAFSRLRIADLDKGAPARDLLVREAATGHLLGPFSPSGRRLIVYRLRGKAWDFGVLEVGTGAVRWFDITPHEPKRGRSLQWRGEDELLVIARDDHRPPGDLKSGLAISERLPAWWSAAARGETAHTVVGSGVYASLRPRDPPRRLLRLDVTSGDARALAEGEFFDLELSPDGARAALFESGPDVQLRADGPARGVAGLETEASRLSFVDLADGTRASACPSCDMLPQLLAWSADSRQVLAFRRGDEGTWSGGRLLQVDSATGKVATLDGGIRPELDLNPVVVRAGWMGADPILYGRPAGGRPDWYRLAGGHSTNLTRRLPPPDRRLRAGDANSLVLLAGDRLWRVDRDGRANMLSKAVARPAAQDQRGSTGARLANVVPTGSWLRLESSARARLAWVDARGSLSATSPAPPGGPIIAPPGPTPRFVRIERDEHGVDRIKTIRAAAGRIVVATINEDLAETDPMRVEPVRHTGDRGEPLVSWLFLPRLPAGAPPPPLIVRPYLGHNYASGPRELTMEDGFFGNLRMLTGHGYAVLTPSLPIPPEGHRDPAAGAAARILAVERAAREDPRLAALFDHRRQAVLGWSFGGYTVMATLTQTDHFLAGVALSGISDLTAYWSRIAMGRSVAPEDGYGSNWATGTVEQTQPQMGGPPWSDPVRYLRNSPLWQADRINTPLMLMHGWRDTVPYQGSEAMFSALFRQGKDAQLVTYWAADHRTVSPGDVRDVWARTFVFLDSHLVMDARSGPPSASPAPGLANGGPRPPRPSR